MSVDGCVVDLIPIACFLGLIWSFRAWESGGISGEGHRSNRISLHFEYSTSSDSYEFWSLE